MFVHCCLQAVFVVTVNLQGLFIFFFHCVRSPAVRSEWRKFLWRDAAYRATTTSQSHADTASTDSRHIIKNNDALQFNKHETRF